MTSLAPRLLNLFLDAPRGNVFSAVDLGAALQAPEREVRRAVRTLNNQGHTICAKPGRQGGFFYSHAPADLNVYANRLRTQAEALERRAVRVEAMASFMLYRSSAS